MANRRLPMRKIKEVLRLKYDSNLSEREISRSCQVSRSTVADYLMKAKVAGISWPEALGLTDTQIEKQLFPVQRIPSSVKRPAPASPSLSTAMICSSVYFFAFTRALLMTFYHRKTLRATGLTFGGRVKRY